MKNDRLTLNKLIDETENDIVKWTSKTKGTQSYYSRKLIGKKSITNDKIVFFVVKYNMEYEFQTNFGLKIYLANNKYKTTEMIYEIKPGIITFRVNSLINKLIKTIEGKVRIVYNKSKTNNNSNDLSGITFSELSKSIQYRYDIDFLNLQYKMLLDLNGLKNFTNLKTLYCDGNKIESIKEIENLTKLNELSANNNNLKNLDGLEKCINLKNIYCSKNKITNIDNIETLSELVRLDVSNNELTNIDVIKKLKKLEVVYCYNNNFSILYLSQLKDWCRKNDIILI